VQICTNSRNRHDISILNFMTLGDCPCVHGNNMKPACNYPRITRAETRKPHFLPLQRTERFSRLPLEKISYITFVPLELTCSVWWWWSDPAPLPRLRRVFSVPLPDGSRPELPRLIPRPVSSVAWGRDTLERKKRATDTLRGNIWLLVAQLPV
jgi:hypothetical protein